MSNLTPNQPDAPHVSNPNASPALAVTSTPDSASVQKQVLSNLNLRRGILNGRELYRQYGERNIDLVKAAVLSLEKQNLVSVKGNLEDPLGVFQSVIVRR
jgi:hypothetical protein